MSAPNNNDDDIPSFSRSHRLPRPLRRTSSGSPVLRSLVRRNETLSSPQIPPQPPQISTLRPASVVPSARPLLRDTRNLLEAQRRVLSRQSGVANPRGRPSSSWTMAEMQLEEARRQLEDTNRRLEQSIENAQRLLEQPLDLPAPKRRRLEAAPTEEDEKPKIHQVNYGYEGAVVPGKLDMTLEYCDGGVFEEGICCEEHKQPTEDFFGVKNIFKNNDSVYCTKDSRCNIIIKHEGGRPFTMKELIIKAPRNGYTSPVKEGMVFVAMDVDELMLRTAEYKIQYDKKKKERRLRTASVRHLPGGGSETTHRDSVSFATKDSAAIIPDEFIGEDEGYKVETFCTTDDEFSDEDDQDNPHPWHPEAHDQYLYRQATSRRRRVLGTDRLAGVQANVGDALLARAQALGEIDPGEDDSDNDDDDDDDDDDVEAGRRWAAQENNRLLDRERRALDGESVSSDTENTSGSDSDSDSDEEEDETMSSSADADAVSAVDPDANKEPADTASNVNATSNNADHGSNSGSVGTPKMLQASAHFTIQRGKSSCKMVFEPALSARFVLLKLYCPDAREGRRKKDSRKGNIDVQNVTVRGWCGPRVFRSTDLM